MKKLKVEDLKIGHYYLVRNEYFSKYLHKETVAVKFLGIQGTESANWELTFPISYDGFTHSCGDLGRKGYCYYGSKNDEILREIPEREILAYLI